MSWVSESMASIDSWVDLLGYAASAAVLATFCMSTMIPLRVMALASNVLFIAYGYADHLFPVLLLHTLLFPVNAFRLIQFYRLMQQMRQIPGEDLSIQTLLPHMTWRTIAAGETLVRKGERADRLYYLVDGELEVADFKKALAPGAWSAKLASLRQIRRARPRSSAAPIAACSNSAKARRGSFTSRTAHSALPCCN